MELACPVVFFLSKNCVIVEAVFTEILFAGLQFVLTVCTKLCRVKFLGNIHVNIPLS